MALICKSWRSLTFICLEEIDFSAPSQRNQQFLLSYAASFLSLKSLNLEGWGGLSDVDVEYISERCQSLIRVNLAGCWQITDYSLFVIGENCPNLRHLNLRSCPKITNEGLEHLIKCSQLESLNLSKCTQINSEGLSFLAQFCTHIRELDLSYFKLGKIQQGLQQFTQLESLYLEGRQLKTSEDEEDLSSNGNLETLFEHLTNLQALSLQGSPLVSPRVREAIRKHCSKLKSLNLQHT